MRRKTTRHIAKLPAGVTEAMGSGRIRNIVHESGAATKVYLVHPRMAGSIATPAGCGMGQSALLSLLGSRFGMAVRYRR